MNGDGWTDGQTDGWMDGQTVGWMKKERGTETETPKGRDRERTSAASSKPIIPCVTWIEAKNSRWARDLTLSWYLHFYYVFEETHRRKGIKVMLLIACIILR